MPHTTPQAVNQSALTGCLDDHLLPVREEGQVGQQREPATAEANTPRRRLLRLGHYIQKVGYETILRRNEVTVL